MNREPRRRGVLLIPPQPEPSQPLKDRLYRRFGVALDVGIVEAQNHRAAGVAREQPVEKERARRPDVQKSGRGWRKPHSCHGNASIAGLYPFTRARAWCANMQPI